MGKVCERNIDRDMNRESAGDFEARFTTTIYINSMISRGLATTTSSGTSRNPSTITSSFIYFFDSGVPSIPIYNNSKAFKQASAVTVALAGFAPVTTLPSVTVNASHGPSGLTYVAPEAAAEDSMVATPHSLIFSTCPRSSSPLVVKPVTFLPLMMDFLVE